jgi:hypothetical protein
MDYDQHYTLTVANCQTQADWVKNKNMDEIVSS